MEDSMEIVSLADAVSVLDYLHKRKLLCDKCGSRIAEYENQFHARCGVCRAPNAVYNKAKIPNELEKRIAGSLHRWNEHHPSPEGHEGGRVGDVAGDSGGQPAP